MRNKAQVLMIILWILALLVILVVTIGHRVSMALRLGKYQRDGLRAYCLAEAGVNRAIAEINKDSNDYDAFNEPWADKAEIFARIKLTDNDDEFAAVSYGLADDASQVTIFGAIDEERKINLNTASQELLVALLEGCGIEKSKAGELANNIRVWSGAQPMGSDVMDDYKNNLGYPCKGASFTNIEELILVKGMKEIEPENFEKLKALITAYSNGKININTASRAVLRIVASAGVAVLGSAVSQTDADGLVEEIIKFRNKPGYFTSSKMNPSDISVDLTLGDATDKRVIIVKQLLDSQFIVAVSENFRIEATGNIGTLSKKITAVIKRSAAQPILCWHEN